jgi:hypothetical protein
MGFCRPRWRSSSAWDEQHPELVLTGNCVFGDVGMHGYEAGGCLLFDHASILMQGVSA